MFRSTLLLVSILLFGFQTAHSEAVDKDSKNTQNPSLSDSRQFVSMPEQALNLMRQDMLSHLSTLNEIFGFLASNNLEEAANIAERNMGKSSMGKHRGTNMAPGRLMPIEMRNIAWGMHSAATDFSEAAKQGNLKDTYASLQTLTRSCVACHYGYRTR